MSEAWTSLLNECDQLLSDVAKAQVKSTGISKYIPIVLTPKQKEFFDLDTREVLFGGAAGGGKSLALLAAALKYVDHPDYRALILRRNFPQLIQAGGLIDVAHQWLTDTDAQWSAAEKTWHFPSGATLSFGHMQNENDKYTYQGGSWQFIGFDELTQFTETQYLYLHSRLRGPEWVGFPFRIRAASNPGGIGFKFVKTRFIDPKSTPSTPGSPDTQFIQSLLQHNPHLNQEEYLKSLNNLDPITRRQYRDGEWIDNTQGMIYGCSDHNLIDSIPNLEDPKYVLAIDLGASQSKPTTAFVVLAWSAILKDKVFVLESKAYAGLSVSDIASLIQSFQEIYPFDRIIMDQGALGAGYIREMQTKYLIPVDGVQKQNKLGYRKILASELKDSNVLIVQDKNKDLIEELRSLQWNDKGIDANPTQPDHLSDGLLYGFRETTAYLSQAAPPPPPAHGTPEWLAQEEERLERMDQETYHRANQAWFKRKRN